MFPFPSSHGVLGLNARSLLFIKPFNPKKATALADSKLKTKAYLAARGIPVAKLHGRIETREQAWNFDFTQLPDECVLKPNQGYGGEGIIVLKGRDKRGRFLRNGKTPIDERELREHIEDILDGKFSLKGVLDTAFFEQILKPHNCFAQFRPAGLPDIRVIVFNLVPVMAMLRIPTAESDGKANIHLGGIGIGIDIAKGITTHAAQFHHMVEELPHGGSPSGHSIPYWEEILLICSRIQKITNIGYLAVDIAIDEQIGPALLEVNARAGLMVQVANLAPLRARLERVQGIAVETPEKGVRIGQDLFGNKTPPVKKDGTTEKKTLGVEEPIQITLGDGSIVEVIAAVAGTTERTTFPEALVIDLLEKNGIEPDETENLYRVKFSLGGKKIQTVIQRLPESNHVVIGSRDLSSFLIDPTKKSSKTVRKLTVKKSDVRAVDKLLGQIDREMLLLKHIKPLNLEEEMDRLRGDPLYNPVFLYRAMGTDIGDAEKRLQEVVRDESPLGILLEKKRKELLARLALLKARGNATSFTEASFALFGNSDAVLVQAAQEELRARFACDLEIGGKERMTAERAAHRFEKILQQYSLHNWQVSIRKKLVADVTVGGTKIYVRADATFTEEHIASLIAHEIETHVLTSENGAHQPYDLLRRGCAGYLETQEGLAIWNQNGVLSPHAEKRFNPPKNVLGIAFGLQHSLAQTRTYLQAELGLTAEKALTQSVMMKRGLTDTAAPGCFTKGLVYFRGRRAIEAYLKEGNSLARLYIGKVTLQDLELIEKLPDIKDPLILPEFLR